MGTVAVYRNEVDRGIEHFEASLVLYGRSAKIDPALLGVAHNNIAMALYLVGRSDEADRHLAEARTRLAGPAVAGTYRSELAATLSHASLSNQARGNHAIGLKLAQESVSMLRGIHPEAPQMVPHLATLAWAHRRLGQLVEARQVLELALKTARKVSGPTHRSVADTLAQLASLCEAEKDQESAKRYYRSAADVLAQTHPLDPATRVRQLTSLGDYRRRSGEPELARVAQLAAVDILRAIDPVPRHQLAQTLRDLGNTYLALGSPPDAEVALREALLLLEAGDARPSELATTRLGLARALFGVAGQGNAARRTARRARAEFLRARGDQTESIAEIDGLLEP